MKIGLHNIDIQRESASDNVEATARCFHLATIADDGDHAHQQISTVRERPLYWKQRSSLTFTAGKKPKPGSKASQDKQLMAGFRLKPTPTDHLQIQMLWRIVCSVLSLCSVNRVTKPG